MGWLRVSPLFVGAVTLDIHYTDEHPLTPYILAYLLGLGVLNPWHQIKSQIFLNYLFSL